MRSEPLRAGPKGALVYLTILGAIELGLLWGGTWRDQSIRKALEPLLPWHLIPLILAAVFAVAAIWSLWYLLEPKNLKVGGEIRLALACLLLGDAVMLGVLLWVGR